MSNSSPISNPALSELIRKARNGDQEAFEELLDRYAPLIHSMTSQFCKELSEQDGEDLHQEALVAFYNAVMHYRLEQTEVQFGLYAKDCIRNRLISYLRKLKKHGNVILVDADNASSMTETDAADPAKHLIDEEAYLALYHQVKKTLSDYENRVWWLYFSGRTANEIAIVLQTEEKSVQNALYRIRRKLRSVLPSP